MEQTDDFKLNTNQDAQQKLLDAGFTLYRFNWNSIEKKGIITYVHKPGCWRKHSDGYTTKAALDRKRKELLQDPKALEG